MAEKNTYRKKTLKAVNEIKKIWGKKFVDKFIDGYGDLGKKYLSFLSFDTRNKTHEKIASTIGVDRTRITYWINGRTVPWSIKALVGVYESGFYRIPKHALARIIGWGMGDGGINKRPCEFFFCLHKDDIEDVKKFLEKHTHLDFIIRRNKGFGNVVKYNGEVRYFKGDNWMLYASDTPFARFLYALGLPKGSKVNQEFLVPTWILKGNTNIRSEFLSALMECEMERFRVKKIKEKTVIDAPSFGMSKTEKYVYNLGEFLNQIKHMLLGLGIKTSVVSNPIKLNLRKDGSISIFERFAISSASENIIVFSNSISFKFNRNKSRSLLIAIREARNKINRKLYQIEKFDRSRNMFSNGYSLSNISNELDVPYNTLVTWLKRRDHLPRNINSKRYMEELLKVK